MYLKSKFSIRDLEGMSGIKAHTIRMWEQRYNILKPERTDTNIRSYTLGDLKYLLNIALLNRNGIKISRIARLSEAEIVEKVASINTYESNYDVHINKLVVAMVELDEMKFEKVISQCSIVHGFRGTMEHIIYPFLEKVGIMWMTGSIHPAQEHFISNLIRQKIIVAIDGMTFNQNGNDDVFVLFLPEGELHELSLLYLHYYLRTLNKQVIYLGSSVPFEDLLEVYNLYNPKYLVTIITSSPVGNALPKYLRQLSKEMSAASIIVAGQQINELASAIPSNVHPIAKISMIDKLIEEKINISH